MPLLTIPVTAARTVSEITPSKITPAKQSARFIFASLALGSLALIALVSFPEAASAQVRAGSCRAAFEPARYSPIFESVPRAEAYLLPLRDGRKVSVQEIPPSQPGKPTLMLLPGSNSGILLSSPVVQRLVAEGYGVASLNLSSHSFTMVETTSAEARQQLARSPDVEDYAAEVDAVVQHLVSGRHGHTAVVPVSLSYTGAITPSLRGAYPLVFESVPMTSLAASNPQLGQTISSMRIAEAFNWFLRPINRGILDNSYRSVWGPTIDGQIRNFNLPAAKKSDMVEGAMQLSRAVEEFKWDVRSLPRETRRVFILAGQDSPSLLKHQLQTFRELLGQRDDALLFIVRDATHVLPLVAPIGYVNAIKMTFEYPALRSGIVMLSKDGTTPPQVVNGRAEALRAIDTLINSL